MTDYPTRLLDLTRAATPEALDALVQDTFRVRHETRLPARRAAAWSTALSKPDDPYPLDKVASLFGATRRLVHTALVTDGVTLPDTFHAQLGALLSKIYITHRAEWREAALASPVGPARLVDFDWRVDVRQGTGGSEAKASATVFVDLRLQDPPRTVGMLPRGRTVGFELSPQALGTMVEGLERIRDQLDSIKT